MQTTEKVKSHVSSHGAGHYYLIPYARRTQTDATEQRTQMGPKLAVVYGIHSFFKKLPKNVTKRCPQKMQKWRFRYQ